MLNAAASMRHGQKSNAIALPIISGEQTSELLAAGETIWLNAEPPACGVFSLSENVLSLHIARWGL